MIIKKTYIIPVEGLEDVPSSIVSFSSELPNIFSITHKTHYHYSSPISFSKHLFRLQPEHNLIQSVLSHKFTVSAGTSEAYTFTEAFGNNATFLEIKENYKDLNVVSESIVSVSQLPRKMQIAHESRAIPLIWMPRDHLMMQGYLQAFDLPESELLILAEYAMSFVDKHNHDVFEVLKDMNETIYREYVYVPGSSTLETTPYEVYMSRKGVCQDFANLFICLARLLGMAARYRVGYVYTGGDYKNKIKSEASHAWVEIYLPYLGWIGFDPTNGCLAEKNHIRVASGRSFQDAAPTSGTIFELEEGVEETLNTSVQMILLS